MKVKKLKKQFSYPGKKCSNLTIPNPLVLPYNDFKISIRTNILEDKDGLEMLFSSFSYSAEKKLILLENLCLKSFSTYM